MAAALNSPGAGVPTRRSASSQGERPGGRVVVVVDVVVAKLTHWLTISPSSKKHGSPTP